MAMTREEWGELLLGSVEKFNRYREEHPEETLYLRGVDLCGANLSRANLSEADFDGANIDIDTVFSWANLSGVRGFSRFVFEKWLQELKESIEFAEEEAQ